MASAELARAEPSAFAGSALEENESEHPLRLADLARIILVSGVAAMVWFHVSPSLYGIDVLAVLTLVVGGYPVLREAVENLLARRMTMELSMTIALIAAALIREFFTALIILLFVLIAEVLEEMTVHRGRRAIESLLSLLPRRALIRRGEGSVEVGINEVRPRDIVVVKPGADIPVDGTVVRGHSFVNQASITGESLSVEKVAGSHVFAGTVNMNGSLDVETETVGRATVFGRIIDAVERAEHSRAPVQKLADRLAAYLVYFAMGASALTFLITHNARSSIAVIIVAGACGIAAGTPLAILGAIGRAARNGVIIKGGRFIELLSQVDTVVLDKTGTLTFGNPVVSRIFPASGMTEQLVLKTAAIAERLSEHPVAKAILTKASWLPPAEPDTFEYQPGRGIRCSIDRETILVGNRGFLIENGVRLEEQDGRVSGGTAVLVARSGVFLGFILVGDQIRPEARAAVAELKKLGIRVVLLTGDAKDIAVSVGRMLSVDELEADLLPQQKLERIDELVRAGRMVAMVGDGINDAPALARAAVGMAMGGGTEVARQSADILLIRNDLKGVAETIRLARRCRRIIMTNFFGTLAVDMLGVGLAAIGILNPLLAAFIHVSSELAFIGNSARLIPAVSGGRTADYTE